MCNSGTPGKRAVKRVCVCAIVTIVLGGTPIQLQAIKVSKTVGLIPNKKTRRKTTSPGFIETFVLNVVAKNDALWYATNETTDLLRFSDNELICYYKIHFSLFLHVTEQTGPQTIRGNI